MTFHLEHERYQLDNGLNVILHPDDSLPLAVVNLWYRVGSKDEQPGRTGFAHLFEHLMFMGTDRVPGDAFDRLMEAHGGANNASTSPDRTNYYAQGPSEILPVLLWLEADRMGTLGKSMTQSKLDLQRKVVRNERRQSYENRPYGRTWLELPSLLYPEGHPYHHPTIGSHEDLEAATVQDVKDFFDVWYRPNNASLVVAGQFDRDEVRKLIDDWFAPIPRGAEPPRTTALKPTARGIRTLDLQDQVPVARSSFFWSSPRQYESGDADASVLASVLADGAASRLEQFLVHRHRLVQGVSAYQIDGHLGSEFMVAMTALPDVPIEQAETALFEELERIKADGVSQEDLERAVGGIESEYVRGLQSLQERADALNQYHTWLGDPDRVQWDMDRYTSATADSVHEWARNILDLSNHARLRVIPGGSAPVQASDEEDADPTAGEAQRPIPDDAPSVLSARAWSAPEPDVAQVGSAPLWHVESHKAPLVTIELLLPIGAEDDPQGKEGLMHQTCDLLTEGAGSRDSAALSTALDQMGSRVSVQVGRHSSTLFVACLRKHLRPTLELAADVLLRPRLAEEGFQRRKAIILAGLKQRDHHPDHLSIMRAQELLLGHLKGQYHPVAGHQPSVESITHAEVDTTYRRLRESLSGARLVTAGAISTAEVGDLTSTVFGLDDSRAVTPEPIIAFPAQAAQPLRVHIVHRESAPQTVIRLLNQAPALGSEETAPIRMANTVFGGSFTSRLNQNLRERHGFTYGAGSAFQQGPRLGVWAISSTVRTDVTGRAVEEIRNELDALRSNPITERELHKARASSRTGRIRGFETTTSIVNTLAPYAVAGLPSTSCSAEFLAEHQVTLKQVRKEGIAPMTTSGAVLVLVGDESLIRPQLEKLRES